MLVLGIMMTPVASFAQDAATSSGATPDQEASPAKPSKDGSKSQPKSSTDDSQVVVVTGIRHGLQTAQSIKKNADQIVDSITAVDIGALPDRTVADALQRVTGVTITRAATPNDPIRMTAEAGGVLVRGMTFVRPETNGHDIYSAKGGRSLSWGDISADMLAGIDVYKNASADLIEGGLAGTINLRTLMPFDRKGDVFAASVDEAYGDIQRKYKPSGSFVVSRRFDSPVGEVGVLFNYSYSEEGNQTNATGLGQYDQVSNTGHYIPNFMGYRTVDWNQTRKAANLSAQWRPNDSTLFFLRVLNTRAEIKNTEFANQIGGFGEITSSASDPNSDFQYGSDGLFKTGTVKFINVYTDTRYETDVNDTTDITVGGQWNVSDKLAISGDVQSLASFHKMSSMTVFLFNDKDYPNVFIDLTNKNPSMIYTNEAGLADISHYYWSNAMDHIEQSDAHGVAAKLDAKYVFDDGDFIKYVKLGVRATDKRFNNRSSTYNWGTLGEFAGNQVYVDSDSAFVHTFSDYMHGGEKRVSPVVMADPWVVNGGPQQAYAILKHTEKTPWGQWTPLQDQASTYYPGTGGNFTDINEKTEAVYATAAFETSANINGANRAIDGNFGVRVVNTKTSSSGFFAYQANTQPPAGSTCSAPLQPSGANWCNDYAAFTASKSFVQPIQDGRTYTEVLPSLNIRFKYNNELQFRFAVGQTMSRADYSQLGASGSLSASFAQSPVIANAYQITSAPQYTGWEGNPSLKPMLSTNLDLTAEWYFNPQGALTVDLFNKNVRDYISAVVVPQSFAVTSSNTSFAVTTYENIARASANGFEIGYHQMYDKLPGALSGLGTSFSYTYIDSQRGANAPLDISQGAAVTSSGTKGLPWEQVSKESYNAEVYYEKYGISARLAYNWRSSFLLTAAAANANRPMWSDDYGQLDGSFIYSINSHYKVGIQGSNLLKANTYLRISSSLTDPNARQFYAAIASDQRISAFLRVTY